MDENNADSSTALIDQASDAALAENDFERYSEIENARDAAAHAGKPLTEAPAPSTKPSEKTAASDTATGKETQETGKGKGAKERKAELNAEIQDLLKKRAELKAEVETAKPGEKKTDPPPAAVVETTVAEAAKPGAPKEPELKDFATYAEYQAADRKYIRELVQYEAKQLVEADRAEQAASAASRTAQTVWEGKVAAAKEEYSDYAEVAFSKETPITPVMDGFILDSDHGARLLYLLGQDGSAEGKRIAALQPYAAVRALVALEASLDPAAKKEAPAKRQHTAAPPPATDLGARNAEPSDKVRGALAGGDYAAYEREANARDIKAQRGL